MSEEKKLLLALCEALGFKVVGTVDTEEREVGLAEFKMIAGLTPGDFIQYKGWRIRSNNGAYITYGDDDNRTYTAYRDTFGYKLVKKED